VKSVFSILPGARGSALGADTDLSFVPETRLGFWFLGTKVWTEHVLALTLDELETLIPQRKPSYPVILDAGCGQGNSFRLLIERFNPERLIAFDVEEKCVRRASIEAAKQNVPVRVQQRDIAALALPDASVDLVFCHQTFHHLTRQHLALKHFYRMLKPGGILLFAESTRAYIESWLIRLLFRHPTHSQRNAHEYLAMLREQGFGISRENVSLPYLWWSRPDLGALEFFGLSMRAQPEATLINLAAVKPR
jgi:SAM-dependent methyltransferase